MFKTDEVMQGTGYLLLLHHDKLYRHYTVSQKTSKLIKKKQTYMKTEACKLCSRVF